MTFAANDGFESKEAGSNSFSPTVRLIESVIFERGSDTGLDIITIFDGLGQTLKTFNVAGDGSSGESLVTVSNLNLVGDIFKFQRTGGSGNLEGVRIKELTVSAVPLPASLPFLFAGMGALGIAAKRRRKTSVK